MKKKMIIALALVLLLVWISPALAGTDQAAGEAREISIEDAISMVFKNSKSYQIVKMDFESAQKKRDSALDKYQYSKNSAYIGGGLSVYNSVYESAEHDYQASLVSFANAEKQYEMEKESLEYSVYADYYALLEKTESIRVLKASMDRDQLLYRARKVYFDFGMATRNELQQAESTVNQSRLKYDSALRELDNARTRFSHALGLKDGEDFTLTSGVEFAAVEITGDLDRVFYNIYSSDPTLDIAEANAGLAARNVGYYDSDGTRQISADKQELSTAILRENKMQAIRDSYSSLISLEENCRTAQEKLNQSEVSYKIKNITVQMGMASRIDLLSAEADLESARQGLQSAIIKHQLAKMKFFRPWL